MYSRVSSSLLYTISESRERIVTRTQLYMRTCRTPCHQMRSGQRERPHAPKRPQRQRHGRETKRHQDARVVAVRGEDGRVGEGRVLLDEQDHWRVQQVGHAW